MSRVINQSIEDVDIRLLKHHPRNANQGDVEQIKASLAVNGWYGSVVVNKKTNHILAGNHRVMAAKSLGWETVPVTWIDVDKEQELRILLADNRTTRIGIDDQTKVADILAELAKTDLELSGTGYSSEDLDSLIHSLSGHEQAAEDERGLKSEPLSSRKYGVDLIFSLTPTEPLTFTAVASGWMIGCISTCSSLHDEEKMKNWTWKYKVNFIDNEFKSYDHAKHLNAVRLNKPKYCTVMDVMTKAQCDGLGIKHHSLSQILEWAEELNEYAENVIVIPKHDIIDKIPEKFMCGYSVPSSYGATPLPSEAFKGRRVHLLGGSWKSQMRYLDLLPDEVVSLDNNHINNIARWGQAQLRDGSTVKLWDLGLLAVNPRSICLTISFGEIGRAIQGMNQEQIEDGEPEEAEER